MCDFFKNDLFDITLLIQLVVFALISIFYFLKQVYIVKSNDKYDSKKKNKMMLIHFVIAVVLFLILYNLAYLPVKNLGGVWCGESYNIYRKVKVSINVTGIILLVFIFAFSYSGIFKKNQKKSTGVIKSLVIVLSLYFVMFLFGLYIDDMYNKCNVITTCGEKEIFQPN